MILKSISFFLSVIFINCPAIADLGGNDCTSGWREVDWKIAHFIDLNARYFSYQFRIPRGQKIQLKIEGDFPIGRYTSFHVYD